VEKNRPKVVEYRDSEVGKVVRVFLHHRQDSPAEPMEVGELRCRWEDDPGPIYQVNFFGGRAQTLP